MVGSVDSKTRDSDPNECSAGILKPAGVSWSGKSCHRSIIGRAVNFQFDDADDGAAAVVSSIDSTPRNGDASECGAGILAPAILLANVEFAAAGDGAAPGIKPMTTADPVCESLLRTQE